MLIHANKKCDNRFEASITASFQNVVKKSSSRPQQMLAE